MTTPARAAASEIVRMRSRTPESLSSTRNPSETKKSTLRPGSGPKPRTTEASVCSVLMATAFACWRMLRARLHHRLGHVALEERVLAQRLLDEVLQHREVVVLDGRGVHLGHDRALS